MADILHEVRAHPHGINILHCTQPVLFFPKTTELSPSVYDILERNSAAHRRTQNTAGTNTDNIGKGQTEWVFDSSPNTDFHTLLNDRKSVDSISLQGVSSGELLAKRVFLYTQ